MTELHDMKTWWHPAYLDAARSAYPDVCAGHDLAVGWKLTSVTGETRGGYYWPLVHGDHDLPVLHECDAWDDGNTGSCPKAPGDGLCLVTDDGINEASSGGRRLTSSVGRVLVWPRDLARSDTIGKWRTPWCIDVDCFDPTEMIRLGYVAYLGRADLGGAYLGGANLQGAYLGRANLQGAYLSRANLQGAYLHGADLGGANLHGADLRSADLGSADLGGADLGGADLRDAYLRGWSAIWPDGFDWRAAGVIP